MGQQVAERIVQRSETATAKALAAQLRGWYNFAAEGRGFLLVEVDGLQELGPELMAYHDLMSWKVTPVSSVTYDAVLANSRAVSAGAR